MRLVCVIAFSLMFGSAACVVDMEQADDEIVESAAELGEVAQELDTAQEADDVQLSAAGTFHFNGRENCIDLFTRTCSTTFPLNQCPGAQPGLSCAPAPFSCWKVINASTVDIYDCL